MRIFYLSGLIFLGWMHAFSAEVPLLFDTFGWQGESRMGWQSFKAAERIEWIDEYSETGRPALKVYVHFTSQKREATLIWRFADVQMKKFNVRLLMPKQKNRGDVFLHALVTDTRGDAWFLKPWIDRKTVELPYWTRDGRMTQPASPLPVGRWVEYTVNFADDIFYHLPKEKPNHPVQDFALMNISREALNLNSSSRSAVEAVFISFQILPESVLIDKDVVFYLDLVEIL